MLVMTRTSNTVYLRPNSATATAVMSHTIPPASQTSPTITLDTTTGAMSARHVQDTGYVMGYTATVNF
jgi:hypothetical protein